MEYVKSIMVNTLIVGHRGASSLAKENTRDSFEKAITCGVKCKNVCKNFFENHIIYS